MKPCLLALLITWTAWAGATQSITVQGIVKNQDSAQPLTGAQVTLTVSEAPPDPLVRLTLSPETPPEALDLINETLAAANVRLPIAGAPLPRPMSWTTTTDGNGRFEISNISAGTYTVSARVTGFVGRPLESGVSPPAATSLLNVATGEKPADVELVLLEGSTVDGRVTAADGNPVTGVTVVPFLLTYRVGLPTLAAGGPSRTTDSSGVYHLSALGPGEYYIAAIPPRPAGTPNGEAWARTFYPSTLDPLTVAPLRIAGKSAFRGIDIRIQTTQTFSVRGRAINPLNQGPTRKFSNGDVDTSVQTFSIVPRSPDVTEAANTVQNAVTTEQARRNGEFEIRGIRPGLYDIFPVVTSIIDGEPRYGSGRLAVEIRDRDVEGLAVSITSGIDVTGHITVNGDASMVKVGTLRVSLRALDNTPVPIVSRLSSSPVQSDGSFVIKHVPEALYTVALGPLPAGVYVADIRQRGASVFDNGFFVGTGPFDPLELILKTDGQSLEGMVVDTKQSAASGARIVLVPGRNRRQNGALYRTATAGSDGRFTLSSVPPGEEYKAFASKSIPAPFWQNPDFLARYESSGGSVSVKVGAIPKLQLTTIER